MNKKSIVYYSQLYFLDSALETMNCIKNEVDIHLIIEISPDSITSTVFDLVKSNLNPGFNKIESIISQDTYVNISTAFIGLKSFTIYYIDSNRSISFKSFLHSSELSAYIKAINPDCIHFDSSSFRFVFAFPWLLTYKKILTIHDPIAHSGESTWKRVVSNYVYMKMATNIVLYSLYAKKIFENRFFKLNKSVHLLHLLPYRYISSENNIISKTGNYILFFGRLSIYKGIDILLDAIPKVLDKFPDEKFLIAGKPENGFDSDFQNSSSIFFILRYLQVDELRELILNAKFVVCPYRDATQSGVLMTCFALNKSVVATNVGAFPEYISNGYNGVLSAPDAVELAVSMNYALTDNLYEQFNLNLKNSSFKEDVYFNNRQLKEIYEITE